MMMDPEMNAGVTSWSSLAPPNTRTRAVSRVCAVLN
jgi:hypothetical protein